MDPFNAYSMNPIYTPLIEILKSIKGIQSISTNGGAVYPRFVCFSINTNTDGNVKGRDISSQVW